MPFLRKPAQERLVLTHRLALVVEDRPTAPNPTWTDRGPAFDQRPRFGLNFFLDFTLETVGIAETNLNRQPARGDRVAAGRFPRQGRRENGRPVRGVLGTEFA